MIDDQFFLGSTPHRERMDRVENGDGRRCPSVKPLGGIWTSSARGDTCAWWENVRVNVTHTYLRDHPYLALWRCKIREDAQVWHIDSYKDLDRLLTHYGRKVEYTPRRRKDWELYRAHLEEQGKNAPQVARIKTWVPDYSYMIRDGWEGVHLTERGQLATCNTKCNLYGWDCESTFWLCWVFSEIELYAVIGRD